MSPIFKTSFVSVYKLYVAKLERKGRDVFDAASLNPNAALITGTICGVKIQEIEDPLMLKIRYLDKLVDELANGRPLTKVLRS